MVLVTGATGYVGRHAIARFAASQPVRGLVRGSDDRLPGGVDRAVGDITVASTLPPALEGVETVVHCAAITGDRREPYRGAYEAVNRVGTENLVRAAREAGVRRFVYVSGLGTQPGRPGTYMATRWGAEEAVRSSGIAFVILQPSVLFGDRAPFVTALARLVRVSPFVPVIGSGQLRFQPLHVDDLVSCLEIASRDGSLDGAAYPIGGPDYVTFREVVSTICAAMHRRRLILPIPLPVARIQARLMAAVLANPPLTPAALELFAFDNTTALDAVDRTFRFHPRGFREHLLANGVAD